MPSGSEREWAERQKSTGLHKGGRLGRGIAVLFYGFLMYAFLRR